MLSPREEQGLGWARPWQPLEDTGAGKCWEHSGFPPPRTPAASLCTDNLKMEAKTQYTWDRHARTHMHTGVCPPRAGRQLHSESTKECIRAPPGQEGGACAPLVLSSHSSPPIVLLAARGRGGQHTGRPGQRGGIGDSSGRCPQNREAVLRGPGGARWAPGLWT